MPELSLPLSTQRGTAAKPETMRRLGAVMAMAVLLGSSPQAQAMPVQPTLNQATPVVQVYNGCGLYGHRGPYGGCRPGGQRGGYGRFSCPSGFHVGRYGHFCFRN